MKKYLKGLKELESINSFRAIFKQPPLTLSNRQEILDYVECELSPENLSCDGEASAAQIRAKREALLALKELAENTKAV